MRAAVALIVVCLLSAVGARAAERQTLTATVGGQDIRVYVYRPKGPGPFPLMILSHGVPRISADFGHVGPEEVRDQAVAYADHGVIVAVPIRRGYGGQGRWAEGYGGCDRGDYYAAGMAGADDIAATRELMLTQPGVDPARVVLMGVSGGAWASLAAATRIPGLMGVVAFAPGRGSRGPDDVCHEDTLIQAAGRFGAETHTPELWVFSDNDRFFGPRLAKAMHDAFTAAGGQAVFRGAPPYGRDGHAFFAAVPAWKGMVDSFLKLVGFLR